jgi:DNA-binding GntR family transcriptional regulator
MGEEIVGDGGRNRLSLIDRAASGSPVDRAPAPTRRRGLSLGEQAYDTLRSAITNGTLAPGEYLPENNIAGWLGISRTPVRQALQRLEKEGLLSRSPGGGLVVSELTQREVLEICESLKLLDVFIFQQAARGLTEGKVKELVDLSQMMCVAAQNKDVDAWTESDGNFHRILEEAANNFLLVQIARQLRGRIHRFWVSSASRQRRLEDCSREHRDIATAIQRNDLTTVATLTRDHISHMEASLLAMLTDPALLEH